MATQHSDSAVSIAVENVGGIVQTAQQFDSGVTLLSGRNATNRTSFLQAIMAALGSRNVSLRASADEGSVEMSLNGETYTRTLTRTGDRGRLSFGGDPYTDDIEAGDLFAFLLGDNTVRQQIRGGDVELRDVVMRPVDTDAINDRIERLTQELGDLETQVEELERQRSELPSLKERRETLRERVEAIESRIQAKQTEITETEVDIQESREQQQEFDEVMADLNTARDRLTQAQDEREAEKQSLSTLRSRREQKATELEKLSVTDADEGKLKSRRNELLSEQETLQTEIDQLTQVLSFNRDLLNEERPGITDELADTHDEGQDALTDQLLEGDSTVCWTCGQSVDESNIQNTLDVLTSYKQEKIDDRNAVDSEVSDIENTLRTLRSERAERESLQTELDALDDQIETTERTVESIATRIDRLEDEVADLESTVTELEVSDRHDRLVELHDELNELKRERDSLQRQLEPVEDDIEAAVAAEDRLTELQADIEEKRAERQDLRTRIDSLEASAVEAFNTNMDDILDILEYDNISRVWLERRQVSVQDGRRTVEQTVFDLNVVRARDDGSVFTDRIEHLSESEREVVGLVFGLAGYVTHDVYEDVPFVLLDSLEAIDSARIADVIDYFSDFADYTVAALLPEDTEPAKSLESTETVVSDI